MLPRSSEEVERKILYVEYSLSGPELYLKFEEMPPLAEVIEAPHMHRSMPSFTQHVQGTSQAEKKEYYRPKGLNIEQYRTK